MSQTQPERPSVVELLKNVPERKPPSEIEKGVAELVEKQRVQRDQRYAMAMNIVAQSRKHSGRDSEITTASDAATVNMIFTLLQGVAKEESDLSDPIFTNIPQTTIDTLLELVVTSCINTRAKTSTED
jgi:hypothetical protein